MKSTLQDLLESLPPEIVSHIQHLERMRQDFVANVSHELRTPLTVIHGYLETLLDQTDDNTTQKKIFLQMYQQTLRMEHLTEDLLLLSRLENNETDTLENAAPVPIAELLNQICQEATIISGESKHNISLEADKSLLLKGSHEELRGLFSNLIFNAVKYTPASGNIHVSWYKENNEAHFSVKDNGIGIAAEHIPKLTERFYRVDRARSRASGGTGLGLAIAKHILIHHRGTLKINSTLGKGSEFICLFPID